MTNFQRRLALAMAILLGSVEVHRATGQEMRRVEFDFRNSAPVPPVIAVFGPDAERLIRPNNKGLMINLPAGRADRGAVGITPKFHLSGDFEVLLNYELFHADQPQKGLGSGIKMWVQIDGPANDAVTLAHLVQPDKRSQIVAIRGQKGEKQKFAGRPAIGKQGVLKVKRVGNEMIYLAGAKPEECQELYRCPISQGDVRNLRISANTHGEDSKVGLYISKISFSGSNLPETSVIPPKRSTPWLFIGIVVTAGAALGYFGWRRFRRSRGAI